MYVQKVPGSNFGRVAGISNQVFRGFTQSNHANAGKVPQNKPLPPPFKILLTYYS